MQLRSKQYSAAWSLPSLWALHTSCFGRRFSRLKNPAWFLWTFQLAFWSSNHFSMAARWAYASSDWNKYFWEMIDMNPAGTELSSWHFLRCCSSRRFETLHADIRYWILFFHPNFNDQTQFQGRGKAWERISLNFLIWMQVRWTFAPSLLYLFVVYVKIIPVDIRHPPTELAVRMVEKEWVWNYGSCIEIITFVDQQLELLSSSVQGERGCNQH